jgi:hypothetical protein
MTKEKSYCVMGTSVRTNLRVEVSNQNVHITKEEAEKTKVALEKAFNLTANKEYTMKNLRVALRK